MSDPPNKRDREDVDPEILRAEAEIARARESVAQSITALEQEISRTFDWREWIRRRPILIVTGAFAVGVFLGSLGGRRKHR